MTLLVPLIYSQQKTEKKVRKGIATVSVYCLAHSSNVPQDTLTSLADEAAVDSTLFVRAVALVCLRRARAVT